MGEGTTRRQLMWAAGAGLTALGAARLARAEEDAAPPVRDGKKLKILILGGTRFLGPATVDAALARGHEVTLFNRGKSNPGMYPDLEKLRGDRDGKLEALEGRKWDGVIDTSAYHPRIADMSAKLLKDNVGHYVFVSTISVYPTFGISDETITEDTPVGTVDDAVLETGKVTNQTYGPFKALCEQAVEKHFAGRAAHVRPGLIVGPLDPTDRFTVWPERVARGGEMLCPGDGSCVFQVIDARDLGAWMVHIIEHKIAGTFNATGFKGRTNYGELLGALKMGLNTETQLTWVDEEFLKEQKVSPRYFPMWAPKGSMPWVDCSRGIAQGLTFRPIVETSRDLLDWIEETREGKPLRLGIRPAEEKKLLAAWHARSSNFVEPEDDKADAEDKDAEGKDSEGEDKK
jgi:2'-hydroxyisoflavone reductase